MFCHRLSGLMGASKERISTVDGAVGSGGASAANELVVSGGVGSVAGGGCTGVATGWLSG
jgi:hypothetical protein